MSFKPKTPDADAIKDAAKKAAESIKKGDPKKFPAGQVSATLYSLSMCCGWVVTSLGAALDRPSSTDTPVGTLVDQQAESFISTKGVSFALNSAEVGEAGLGLIDLRLSVHRKLLEYPGWIDIEATSSPEFKKATDRTAAADANRDLAKRQAESVQTAIFASAGKPGDGLIDKDKDVLPIGLGSDPFTLILVNSLAADTPQTLLDPFSIPPKSANQALQKTRDDYIAQLKAEAHDDYPALRHVDIAINGVFMARLKA